MKKSVLVVLAAIFVFMSCSDDDQNAPNPLIGTWEFSLEGTLMDGEEMMEGYEHAMGCSKDMLLFLPNGVYQKKSFQNENADCEMILESGSWALSENQLVLIHGDVVELVNAEILTLSNTTLKFKFSVSDEEEDIEFIYIYQLNKMN
jgi:hypothetical protein